MFRVIARAIGGGRFADFSLFSPPSPSPPCSAKNRPLLRFFAAGTRDHQLAHLGATDRGTLSLNVVVVVVIIISKRKIVMFLGLFSWTRDA